MVFCDLHSVASVLIPVYNCFPLLMLQYNLVSPSLWHPCMFDEQCNDLKGVIERPDRLHRTFLRIFTMPSGIENSL